MTSFKRRLALMSASFLSKLDRKGASRSENAPIRVSCANCKHCPNANKTYCKVAKKSVKPNTPAKQCTHFEI